MDIAEFQKKIGYIFKNRELIEAAFTHTSYANENKTKSYERLEFLGDAIVDFLVGEYLFTHYPELDEGYMSRIRATLVCEKTLSELAIEIGIDRIMRLGHGAEQAGDRHRMSILADMFEAHIAALYIDSGLDNVRDYLCSIYGTLIDDTVSGGNIVDYKTTLQEVLQQHGACVIDYDIVEAVGPVHDCMFTVNVRCNGEVLGSGRGNSKKSAQQRAAKNALERMK